MPVLLPCCAGYNREEELVRALVKARLAGHIAANAAIRPGRAGNPCLCVIRASAALSSFRLLNLLDSACRRRDTRSLSAG